MGTMASGLRSAFEDLERIRGCRVGICAEGLTGPHAGKRVGVGEDEVLPSASLIKVLVLAELLRRVDSGEVSLAGRLLVGEGELVEDSPVVGAEELPAELAIGKVAQGMISFSDNTATNALISLLGARRINALARDLGLRHTVLRRRMMDLAARSRGEENLTSASDAVALLAAIWRSTFLSSASREFALGLLARQRLTSRLPTPLPPGARFLHKTGDLEGVENDAGFVVHPAGTFALAVLTFGELGEAAPRLGAAVSGLCESFTSSRADA